MTAYLSYSVEVKYHGFHFHRTEHSTLNNSLKHQLELSTTVRGGNQQEDLHDLNYNTSSTIISRG